MDDCIILYPIRLAYVETAFLIESCLLESVGELVYAVGCTPGSVRDVAIAFVIMAVLLHWVNNFESVNFYRSLLVDPIFCTDRVVFKGDGPQVIPISFTLEAGCSELIVHCPRSQAVLATRPSSGGCAT